MQKNYLPVLRNSDLFDGMIDEDISGMLDCLGAYVRHFSRGEYIMTEGDTVYTIGVILSGFVHVIKEDYSGDRAILSAGQKGEVFAASFVCANASDVSVSAIASDDCDIMMLNYTKLIANCKNACHKHSHMLENLLKCIAKENLALTEKLEHLTRKTTKEKLMSYLHARSRDAKSASFAIPFNRQELADYLSVDRSAMSAELGRLKRDGMINFQKNMFEIVGNPTYF